MECNDLTKKNDDRCLSIPTDDHSLRISDRVFKRKFQETSVAVKKIALDSEGFANQEEWEKLVGLQHENIVSYHKCYVDSSARHLVMDLCFASLDVCIRKHDRPTCNLKIQDIMWQILCGLEFLHAKNIIHGNLTLDTILLWRQRPNSKPKIKISGYFPHSNNCCAKDDLIALGYVYYSVTTNDVGKPKEIPVTESQLNGLKDKQRQSASHLINLLLSPGENITANSIKAFFNHPFFTIHLESARCLLTDKRIKDVQIFQRWSESIASDSFYDFDHEELDGLKSIVASPNEGIPSTVTTAFTEYPKMFSEFIWHLTTVPPISEPAFIKGRLIGSGYYGTVHSGIWKNEHGKEIPVACKILKNGTDNDLIEECKNMQTLDHLFIVKCFGLHELNSEKCLITELCEGNLDDYVKEGLESIPKDSLNDKTILGQITLGLAYIHGKGMIHKDLKPANILLWRNKSPASTLVLAKIADFGFAKQLKPEQSQFSETTHLGTKNCMAPELLKAGEAKEKAQATYESDAYSLGIIIGFTVLKGRHPYGNKVIQPLLMSSGCDPILLKDLDWDVTHLILQLTKKEPKERPSVTFVIYHPYFVLGNDKSRKHFGKKMNEYFQLFEKHKEVYKRTLFDKTNIQIWFDLMKSQKENEGDDGVKQALEKVTKTFVKDDDPTFDFNNSGEYYSKISSATTSHENEIYKSVEKWIPRYLSELITERISMAPEFCVCYLWSLLSDKTGQAPFDIPAEDKPQAVRVFDSLEMIECCFGCIYYNKLEEQEELWNLKNYLKDGLKDENIHRLVRKFPRFATPRIFFERLYRGLSDINSVFQNGRGHTILHWALEDGCDISMVTDLLERGADPNFRNSFGRNAVHYAARNETDFATQILELILKKGGDPNQVDTFQMVTPLHFSAMNESSSGPDIMKLLLKYGGKPDDVSNLDGKKTPVHLAVRNKSILGPDILKLLLDNGANPNDVAKSHYSYVYPDLRRTPVHFAVMVEFETGRDNLKFLLDKNGNPNALDENEMTPLHLAAQNESSVGPHFVKLLLKKEGNPNLRDNFGRTPIHYAAMNDSNFAANIIKLLLEKGGDPKVLDKENKTPVDIAKEKNSPNKNILLELLIKSGGNYCNETINIFF